MRQVSGRAGGRVEKEFRRTFDSLDEIFQFIESFLQTESSSPGLLHDVNFAVEELFTNMVKYCPDNDNDILLDVAAADGGVTVTLTDFDVDEFDVTADREVDTSMPLDGRVPGGLGLHLVQRMVDNLEYEYHDRQSTVRFTKDSG